MNFLNNPEYNALKVLVVAAAIVLGGSFVYANFVNPLGGRASVMGYGTTYGTTVVPPTVTTNAIAMGTSATLTGAITATGGANATTRGFFYSTDAGCMNWSVTSTTTGTPCAPISHTTIETGLFGVGPFSTVLTAGLGAPLACGKSYYERAYAINVAGRGLLGPVKGMTIPLCVPATVKTTTATISTTAPYTVTLHGVLASLGTSGPVTLGFIYGSTTSGVYSTSTTTPITPSAVGTVATPFQTAVSGLLCGQSYKFMAKATDASGTAVGLLSPAFTLPPCVFPGLSGASATSTSNTAKLTSTLVTMGGASSVTVGFDVGLTAAAPYVQHITYGTLISLTSYSSLVTGLVCGGKTYHYHGWVTNSAGTTNGRDSTFKTAACTGTAATTANTTPASLITGTSATLH